MKKQLTIIVAISLIFTACINSFEKEDKEIDGLLNLVDGAEEVLLSVDTAKVFTVVRDIKKELWNFGNKYDTLDKEAAFKVADYYANKKSLYFLHKNYLTFKNEIALARTQLKALKQDLHNGAITKEKFLEYYKNEQEIIVALNDKINNAVNGIDISVDKLIEEKPAILSLLDKHRKDTAVANE